MMDAGRGVAMTNEAKIKILKDIIRDLHAGGDIEILKRHFAALVEDVSGAEIGAMEQQLIDEGLPEEEVRKLCDLHVKVFEESLDAQPAPRTIPGHPLHTLVEENAALARIVGEARNVLDSLRTASGPDSLADGKERLSELFDKLGQIEKHYLKKENQLFPRLEERGISGPSKVMWAVHDDIRAHLKDLRRALDLDNTELIVQTGRWVIQEIGDMVTKEEKILFPMAVETLDESDWAKVKKGEEEIGYAWIAPAPAWAPEIPSPAAPAPGTKPAEPAASRAEPGAIRLEQGLLTPEQIDLLMTHLPVDVSFVDEHDTVVYYSATADRIFPRSPGVIGRRVQNCHPSRSVGVVEKILAAFRSGERSSAEFWIESGGRFIAIRYFALRDGTGAYRGALEVTQDVTAIRALRGERRLLDWDSPGPQGDV